MLSPSLKTSTNLVVEQNAKHGDCHSEDVGGSDGVAESEEGETDDGDSFGCVGDGVAERREEGDDAEGDEVLTEVEETIDQDESQQTRPVSAV